MFTERFLLMADDFSGACDVASSFYSAGFSCEVLPAFPVSIDKIGAEVVVINTGSRHLPPCEARERAAAAGKAAKSASRIIYKKVDSALRGNIGAELGALISCGYVQSIVYVPSMPSSGRTVRNGILYIDEIPVSDTHFASDPECPVRESSIQKVVSVESGAACISAKIADFKSGNLSPAEPGQITILDGQTEGELAESAELITKKAPGACVAGPAGIFGHIARLLKPGTADPYAESNLAGPVLVVCGSMTPRSAAQVRRGLDSGYVPIPVTRVDGRFKLDTAELENYPATRGNVIIYSSDTGTAPELPDPGEFKRFIAEAVPEIVKRTGAATIVVFGGETSESVVSGLNLKNLRLRTPLETGVNRFASICDGREINLIVKSGDFGSKNLLDGVLELNKA